VQAVFLCLHSARHSARRSARPNRRVQGSGVASPAQDSDRAELSTIRAQVDELTRRVVAVAAHYDDTADSAIAADLFATERSLTAARRQLDRATAHLES
jgi:hypothetical protein